MVCSWSFVAAACLCVCVSAATAGDGRVAGSGREVGVGERGMGQHVCAICVPVYTRVEPMSWERHLSFLLPVRVR